MQNGRLKFKHAAITMQYERVCLPQFADATRHESFYLHSAGWRCRKLQMLQVPCKCLLFLSLPFFKPWWFCSFACFLLSWLCKTWRASWLRGFVCLHSATLLTHRNYICNCNYTYSLHHTTTTAPHDNDNYDCNCDSGTTTTVAPTTKTTIPTSTTRIATQELAPKSQ